MGVLVVINSVTKDVFRERFYSSLPERWRVGAKPIEGFPEITADQ